MGQSFLVPRTRLVGAENAEIPTTKADGGLALATKDATLNDLFIVLQQILIELRLQTWALDQAFNQESDALRAELNERLEDQITA